MTNRRPLTSACALLCAYAVALQALLATVFVLVRVSEAGASATFAVLCSEGSRAPSAIPGLPSGHEGHLVCGTACCLAGCGSVGVPPPADVFAALKPVHGALFAATPREGTLVGQVGRPQAARAPPYA